MTDAASRATAQHEVTRPFDGAPVGIVDVCGEEQVDRACKTALKHLRSTSFPLFERVAVLERAAELVERDSDRLAEGIANEVGKPIRAAKGEVQRCVETLRFSASAARGLSGDSFSADASPAGAGKLMFTLRRPIGVVAAITPFNFPLNLVAHKLAPAVAAGCPVVLKLAPQAPFTGLALVKIFYEAGLPDGWISTLTDRGADAGRPLVADDIPALVTFTGSAKVGWGIAASAPRKKVLLELGSTAPVIVEPGIDIDAFARRAAASAFGFAGQSCISLQRVIVHEDIEDDVTEALVAAAGKQVVGDPLDDSTDVGPVIDLGAAERIVSVVAAAEEGGAGVVAGGSRDGALVSPTVVSRPARDSRLWTDEIFGPVIGVTSYQEFQEALSIANDSPLRIHAGVFTNDLDKAMAAGHQLDFGGVLVNEIPSLRVDQQPYGGVEEAGNTREGPKYAIEEMTDLKVVSLPM